MKRFTLATWAVLWMAAISAFGQTTDLKELLSGKTIPLEMKFKDLDKEWRRVSASETGNMMQAYSAMLGGSGGSAYYTKGQTVTVGNETYIVAYHSQTKVINFFALAQAGQGGGGKMQEPEKLTPETPLMLSLLNLRMTGSLNDIRPFNLEQEIAAGEGASNPFAADMERARQQSQRISCLGNLKQIGLACHLYANDNREKFPDKLVDLLPNYATSKKMFICPDTNAQEGDVTYVYIKGLGETDDPDKILAYDADGNHKDGRNVLYVDGHANFMAEADFQKALAKQEKAQEKPAEAAPKEK